MPGDCWNLPSVSSRNGMPEDCMPALMQCAQVVSTSEDECITLKTPNWRVCMRTPFRINFPTSVKINSPSVIRLALQYRVALAGCVWTYPVKNVSTFYFPDCVSHFDNHTGDG